MAFTYLKTSFRSLLKNKVITGINILGLSIGISAALVIYLIVQFDYSFDRYEPNAGRIFRVVTHGDVWDNAGVPIPLPRALAGISGIEKSALIMGTNDGGPKIAISKGNGREQRIFRQWLQNFAYHARLSWRIFSIGGIAMLLIALLILSLRAGKAALANPVNNLRSE